MESHFHFCISSDALTALQGIFHSQVRARAFQAGSFTLECVLEKGGALEVLQNSEANEAVEPESQGLLIADLGQG